MSTLSDHLRAICDQHGSLTPALVVDAARDPEHALHSRFDWDDTVAAEKWRREQAGHLIRAVRIQVDPTRPTDLRGYVAVKGEESHQSEYVPTERALADPFTRELLLRQMKRDWQNFKRRWEHMAEFAALIADEGKGDAA